MRLTKFVTENTDEKKRWEQYLRTNAMLKASVSILRDITKKGYKAYIVGGSVRDIILGHNPHDVDIATNCPMDKLESMYKTYDIGKSKDFGIVVVNVGGHQFEIAQFREDGKYTDGRRPDTVSYASTIQEDISRRDFTINGIAYNPITDKIVDPYNGQNDIQNRIIRTIGDPMERFKEDGLRPFRPTRPRDRLTGEVVARSCIAGFTRPRPFSASAKNRVFSVDRSILPMPRAHLFRFRHSNLLRSAQPDGPAPPKYEREHLSHHTPANTPTPARLGRIE